MTLGSCTSTAPATTPVDAWPQYTRALSPDPATGTLPRRWRDEINP